MIQNSTFNSISNTKNPYQGDNKKVLCVCSAGLLRSPTIANVLHIKYGYNTRSAGIQDYALIPVSVSLLIWSDEIIVTENKVKELLLFHLKKCDLYDEEKNDIINKIIVLDISDNFRYMDEKLQEIIIEKYDEVKGN